MRKRSVLLAAIITSGSGAVVSAQVAPSGALPPEPAEITAAKAAGTLIFDPPFWIQRPRDADLRAVYPSRAVRAKVPGAVTVRCRVKADGRMEACKILSEAPPGYGFGSGALKLRTYFRVTPTTKVVSPANGQQVEISTEGMMVDYPIIFAGG